MTPTTAKGISAAPVKQRPQIGFYGCGNADRLVRANIPEAARQSWPALMRARRASWKIPECPACGETHVTKIMFRPKRTRNESTEFQLTQKMQVKEKVLSAGERRKIRQGRAAALAKDRET